MRTVYVNSYDVGKRLLVAQTDTPVGADVVVLHVSESATAKDLLEVFKVVSDFGRKCWIYIDDDSSMEFYYAVMHLFKATSAAMVKGEDRLLHILCEDIKEFTQYSVENFVTETAENYGVDPTYAKYLVVPVERYLKEHSVFVIVKTVLGMFASDEKNFTKFGERLNYFLEVFNSARNADIVYQDKKSQCLSVLTAIGHKFYSDWEKYERFTMSVMLRPYEVWETPEERADVVARTVKEIR